MKNNDFIIVPIGAWCRTAHQINVFSEKNNIEKISFPFDWAITTFESLKRILHKDFYLDKVLELNNLQSNSLGSITDSYTQLIHHHDFPPHKIKLQNETDFKIMRDSAHGRFQYSYKNLHELKNTSKKILFVRWQRWGHPDINLKNAFENENLKNLSKTIKDFLSHTNFSILTITTKKIHDKELPKNSVIQYDRKKYGVDSIILERDLKNGFIGDTESWNKILNKFVNEFK